MSDLIVCKFGGTSTATRERLERVKAIIRGDDRRRYVVLSAPGARHPGDTKVTKLLKDLYGMKTAGASAGQVQAYIGLIAARYEELYDDSAQLVAEDLEKRFEKEFRGPFSNDDYSVNCPDYAYWANLLSAGEYWQARLFAEEFGGEFIDARDCIKIAGSLRNAWVLPETYRKLAEIEQKRPKQDKSKVKVVPGYYGTTLDGLIGLLDDGGSDRTGSEVAVGVGATIYENYSDSPVFAASPKLVKDPQVISLMTRNELRDLSYSGFEIFQQEAILPLEGTSITLHIRSTERYPEEGTRVVEERISDPERPIIGVAYQKDFCAFSVEAPGINESTGVLYHILGVFYNRRLPVEFAASGIDDISVILGQESVRGNVSEISQEVREAVLQHYQQGGHQSPLAERMRVEFTENLGCLVVAGKGIQRNQQVAAEVAAALSDANIETVAESKGVKRRCFIYAISMEQGERAVKTLYDRFIG